MKRPPTKFYCMLNADPVNLFGVPCVPGAQVMAVFLGGARGHFVSWGPVLSVRDKTEKNLDPKKMLRILFFVAVPTSLFSSKMELFWPLVPPIGAVRAAKT